MSEKISHRAKHEQERMQRGVEALVHAEIPAFFKMVSVLAYTGVKPASRLDLPYRDDFMERINKIREALSSFGVPHHEEIISTHGGQRIEFTIARNPVVLEQMRALNTHPHTRHSAAWHQTYGTLLGFPKSAIDAFIHHKEGMVRAPEEIRHTELGAFYDSIGAFRLSKAHWREEIKTVEKWMESIRTVSPELLEHLLSNSSDWQNRKKR